MSRLEPFGLEVPADPPGASLDTLTVAQMREWIDAHRFILLRGFAPPDDLPAFGGRFGEIVDFEFGAVNELQAKDGARNYLYTRHEVPFHWDGAFIGRIPHYIIFHCMKAPAPGAGGETLLTDAIRVLERAAPERRETWERTTITYTTEKVVHYGGRFSSPMVTPYPGKTTPVLRYAEPVHDLNPVALEGAPPAVVEEMHQTLRDPQFCYAHVWRPGDVLIADNFALLHGRNAFTQAAERHLRRVNVL